MDRTTPTTAPDLPEFKPGWVWLTGAGPGDPGLLTLHAANALAQADVIVYDALVNTTILDMARPQAERIHAGKRGGKPSPKQRDISLALIDFARSGKRVCRLKGGDPFVFGRGGEEALALVEAGVPFRVIPGISAGIGGPAYAGIPVTHRDINHAVTFLTGHDQSGLKPATVNWRGIATGAPVLVLYMAMKHLEAIADELISAGRPADDPVAIIANATLPDQQVVETTLDRAADDCRQAGLAPPAIIVIGEAVRLRDKLNWLGAMNDTILQRADPLRKQERPRTDERGNRA
ncbi:MAG: uroporphyrinogen-III C-methyltransferase [Alphaproteobacteria bacterium]